MKPEIILFDTETGGLETHCSLLEAYFVSLSEDLKPIQELHLKIKPNPGEVYVVTAGALDVNHIDLVRHDREALSRNDAKVALSNFLESQMAAAGKKMFPLGHNVHFDLDFVHRQLMSKPEWEKTMSYHVEDTIALIAAIKRKGLMKKNIWALGTVAKELGIKFDPSGLHGAKVDAMLTLEVYRKLLEYLSEPPHIDRVPL